MFKNWILSFFLLLSISTFAYPIDHEFYLDRTQLVSEELNLLKERLLQANHEISHSNLNVSKANKSLLNQAKLDVTAAKSNADSLGIELNESQQTVNRLEKVTQEIDNQLNLGSMFGLKTIHMSKKDINNLTNELDYQTKLLDLEKERLNYLHELKNAANQILQLRKSQFTHIDNLLRSQTLMQLREQQAKSELVFQKEQALWLKKLNELNSQMTYLEQSGHEDKAKHDKLAANIFYVNENINFSYLQMLIARYQDQLQQLRILMTHGNSINLLNKINEEVIQLNKQLARVNEIIKTRTEVLEKRKFTDVIELQKLSEQYKNTALTVANLSQQLTDFNVLVDKSLQVELSSRQGLPGFDSKAWQSIGTEILLLPSLFYHMSKSLLTSLSDGFALFDYQAELLLCGFALLWWGVISYSRHKLGKFVARLPDHESGHVNLKWLALKSLQRNLWGIGIIGSLIGLMYYCDIPLQNSMFFVQLCCIGLLFKSMISFARLYLVESVHDRTGADMRLYYRLKWTFIFGGIVTGLAVYVQGLPVSFELKDLFARLFLLFLLVSSVVVLKNWRLLPALGITHRSVKLMGLIVPFVLIINSAIGLFGFVNLVYTIFWYEGLFLLVLISYLVARAVLIKAMEFFSDIFIMHFPNGWLWTEAFLKPLDRLFRIALILVSGAFLFILYGWDRQSPVVERLATLAHYRIGNILSTTITPFFIIKIVAISSLLYWAAKWTREFVYRLLSTRTEDLGIRNSMAILSQYTMIVVGILIGLRVLGIDLRALAVVAGAFAVTAGFGLRDIINNLASGFLLLIERPLRVGDTVTIDGHEGEVIHLGSRAVIVRTWDHIDIFVPNSEVCSKIFMNWTSKDNIIRTVDLIDIDQSESALEVQKLIYTILGAHKNILKDPAPEVFIKELKEGHVRFEVRYFINLRLIRSRPELRSEVLMSIWQMFEAHGIKPSYPVRDVHNFYPSSVSLHKEHAASHLLPQGEKELLSCVNPLPEQ